jgi:hypothetical protein
MVYFRKIRLIFLHLLVAFIVVTGNPVMSGQSMDHKTTAESLLFTWKNTVTRDFVLPVHENLPSVYLHRVNLPLSTPTVFNSLPPAACCLHTLVPYHSVRSAADLSGPATGTGRLQYICKLQV